MLEVLVLVVIGGVFGAVICGWTRNARDEWVAAADCLQRERDRDGPFKEHDVKKAVERLEAARNTFGLKVHRWFNG